MVDIDKLYEYGSEALKKRNYDYAQDIFTQIITFDPNHTNARKALRMTLVNKILATGSLSKFKLGLLSAKVLGQIQLIKDPKKKIERLQDYLINDPNNAKMRLNLAMALKEAGFIEGAIAELEIAIDSQADFVPAYKELAILYKTTGQIELARNVLQQAVIYAPHDRELGKMLRDILATATLKSGIEEAKSYRDILKDKEKAEELERRQHILLKDEDMEKEFSSLMSQYNQNPNDIKTVKRIANWFYDRKKDFSSARDWYKKASQLDPIDTTLKDRADDCTIRLFELEIEKYSATDIAKANELKLAKLGFEIESYTRRTQDHPTDMSLKFELGRRFYQRGWIDKAISEFQQSVKDPKKKVDSHIYLGICFRHKKLYDLAVHQFEEALTSGAITTEKSLFIKYNIAISYAESGDIPKALDVGKKVMEVDINYKDISKLVDLWSQKVR